MNTAINNIRNGSICNMNVSKKSVCNGSIRYMLECSLYKSDFYKSNLHKTNLEKSKQVISEKNSCLLKELKKWEFKDINNDYFKKVKMMVENSVMANYLNSVLVNVSDPYILIFNPITIPDVHKNFYFPEKNLTVYIADS